MKVGGQILWNVTLICETSQIYYLMGRHPMEDVLGYHFKGWFFHLVHWLSITFYCEGSVKNSSIWKEGLTFLGYALYAGGIWKGDVLVADIEELETMDASEIYSKRLNTKDVIFPREGEFIFLIADWRIKFFGGDQDLRTSTFVRHRPIQWESNIDFLGELEGSLPQPQDSFPDAGEVMTDFFGPCQEISHTTITLMNLESIAERGIILYSTEIHWYIQNYTYEFWCQAREAHWLLEHWWVSRLVWSLDRFHTIYFIGRKSSRRIYVVRGEVNEKTAYIQTRSSVARTLEIRNSKKPSKTLIRRLLLCRVTLSRIVEEMDPTQLKENLRAFWKFMNPQECVWKFDTALSSRLYCRKRREFITALHFGSQIYSYASSYEIFAGKAASHSHESNERCTISQ